MRLGSLVAPALSRLLLWQVEPRLGFDPFALNPIERVGLAGAPILLIAGLLVTGFLMSQDIPQGEQGPKAEALADELLAAINITAWNELKLLQWEFPGGHEYLWDKQRDLVEVKWGKKRVLLDPSQQLGKVLIQGIEATGKDAEKPSKKAYQMFANDSFWLAAFTKVRDDRITELERHETSARSTANDDVLWCGSFKPHCINEHVE